MGIHLLKGAIRGGWRKEWLEISTTTKKMKRKGTVKLVTIFVDWSSICHGNHSRFEIQRRGPVYPVT